ncbi:isochorismatase family protein [Providencia rettgeri]|nr:isochorismatase family protein [Providencia rettgeri]
MAIPANFDGQTPVIDSKDVVFIFVNQQSGTLQSVITPTVPVLRQRIAALSKVASLSDIPVIACATKVDSLMGPIIPEISRNAPHAHTFFYDDELMVWDNKEFVELVKSTGKKQIVIAGGSVSVALVNAALRAVSDGYQVFAVLDASGANTELERQIAVLRLIQVGVVPIGSSAVLCEVQKMRNVDHEMDWYDNLRSISPAYQLLYEAKCGKNS